MTQKFQKCKICGKVVENYYSITIHSFVCYKCINNIPIYITIFEQKIKWLKMKIKKVENGKKRNWGCHICKVRLSSRIAYNYFKGICPVCRKLVPKHIPQEQVEKWLKQRKFVVT